MFEKSIREEFEAIAEKVSNQVISQKLKGFSEEFLKRLAPILKEIGYEEKLLSAKQICEILGISQASLSIYKNQYDLPVAAKNPYRYRLSEVIAWHKRQGKKVTDYKDPLESEVENILSSL